MFRFELVVVVIKRDSGNTPIRCLIFFTYLGITAGWRQRIEIVFHTTMANTIAEAIKEQE